MNNALQKFLGKDEHVLWEGKPEGIKLFENPFPGRIAGMWATSVALVAFTIWYSLFYGPMKEISPVMLRNVGIFCVALAVYIAVRPFLTLRKLHNNVAYCITTERFIAYTPNSKIPHFQFRTLTDFTEVSYEKLSTGKYNLYVGPVSRELRGHARDGVMPYNETQKMDPLVLTSITDPQIACACLPEFFVVHGDIQLTSSNAA